MSNGSTKDPLHYRSWEGRGVHTYTSMVHRYTPSHSALQLVKPYKGQDSSEHTQPQSALWCDLQYKCTVKGVCTKTILCTILTTLSVLT